MPFKIVRNDITKMNTEAIVNTANQEPIVGSGCDSAVYRAAGYEELLSYRKEKIGRAREGEAFLTPGFHLNARYIIHAVSPLFTDGKHGEESRLRACYKNSLQLAKKNGIRSIAFPLIASGSFGYPKEEAMRIAADEINAFLLHNEMEIFLVVFGAGDVKLGKKLYPDLEAYIDQNYVQAAAEIEYGSGNFRADRPVFEREYGSENFRTERAEAEREYVSERLWGNRPEASPTGSVPGRFPAEKPEAAKEKKAFEPFWRDSASVSFEQKVEMALRSAPPVSESEAAAADQDFSTGEDFEEKHLSRLNERMKHLSDTYSQYLLYLIDEKKMDNVDVYKRAIVDKKIFSKIKNHKDYHPTKLTALCLCVGARLNLDESRDLLARAGYALSPCDKTDIIFSYFIENQIYDMIELDIQLEEHGLPCIIE